MALLWIDGFEGYGAPGSISASLVSVRGYTNVSSSIFITVGNMLGYGLRNNYYYGSPGAAFTTPALTTNSTLISGCSFLFYGNNIASINFYDGATLGINATLSPTAPSSLTIKLGSSTIATYSSFTMRYNEWYYLELKVFCHPTSGTVEARIDGVTVISLTGINTQAGANTYHNKVCLIGAQYNQFDDFYICDGSGTTVNDFQGICKIIGLLPSADTGTIQWTPSSGTTHYNLVDSNPANTSDYVYSSTQTNIDLFTYPDLIGTGTIVGFQLNTQAMLSDGTSIILQTPVVSSGSTDLGADYTLTSGTYADFKHISTTDPHTGSAWTIDGLNAAQIGVKVM
jgi:hypothetical protein